MHTRALELAAASDRPADARGVALPRIERTDDASGYHYTYVDATIDRSRRVATLTVRAPAVTPPADIVGIEAAGAAWWPLAMARELDDAILMLRTNELEIGTWLIRTEGDAAHVLAADRSLLAFAQHWFVRETLGLLRRTLARLDVSSRTLFALIEPGACFAGTLLELALAADRSYMAALPDEPAREPRIVVDPLNDGAYPMVNGLSRIAQRFYGERAPIDAVRETIGTPLSPSDAISLGLVTAAPDDIDWTDEIRIAVEERASLSPDALTGLEANLRFGGQETMETRIFGRLSAWQNWIFIRPNAVGETGALKVYGKGERAQFDFKRV